MQKVKATTWLALYFDNVRMGLAQGNSIINASFNISPDNSFKCKKPKPLGGWLYTLTMFVWDSPKAIPVFSTKSLSFDKDFLLNK